ncbi:hypothetical protein D3C71_1115920 [compost metagenome]
MCSPVNQLIVVEGHIIYLIIGSKCKSLRPDFHSNRFSSRLSMNVPFVVHHPPHIEITVKRNSPIRFTIFGSVDIIPRIITFFPFVISVLISVKERCQIVILSFRRISVSRPVFNKFRYLIIREIVLLKACSVLLIQDTGVIPGIKLFHQIFARGKMIIVFQTLTRINFCCGIGQRTCPVILTSPVTQSRQFQLTIYVCTSQPKCRCKEAHDLRVFRNLILRQILTRDLP